MINLFLNIFCSLELVLAHWAFFQKSVGLFSINSLIIFIQAFLLYGLFLAFSKRAILSFALLTNVLILLLLVYHRVYATPIMFNTIFSQYAEGTAYLKRSLSTFISWSSLAVLVYLSAIILLVKVFYHPLSKPWQWRVIFAAPFLIILGLSYNTYHHEMFNDRHFKNFVEIFGYPQGWLYEVVTNSDAEDQLDYIIKMANEAPHSLPKELQNLKPHKHVYLVQIESFQYEAFTKIVEGKAVMPFLNSIAKEGSLYNILPKNPHPSANSDFATIAGINDITDFYYVVYKIIEPKKLYQKITPITWKYKDQGYHLGFYHGFVDTFYNRGPHIKAMKFDDIYFLKDLRQQEKMAESDWGVNDLEMAKFITNNQKKYPHSKSFTFFLSVSSHDPFSIGDLENQIYAKPNSIVERYYNSFNYVDQALEYLVKNAPEDSLFLMYSDHPSLEELPKNTFFMVYSNQQNFKHFSEIKFSEAMQIIKSILNFNLNEN